MLHRDGRPRQAVFGGVVALGLMLILLSWVHASGELRYNDQLTAVNVGVVGTAMVLGACALYLMLFRSTVRGRVARLHSADEVTS